MRWRPTRADPHVMRYHGRTRIRLQTRGNRLPRWRAAGSCWIRAYFCIAEKDSDICIGPLRAVQAAGLARARGRIHAGAARPRAKAMPWKRQAPQLRFAYDELGWDTAISVIDPANTASQGVARRLGASKERESVPIWGFHRRHLAPSARRRRFWRARGRRMRRAAPPEKLTDKETMHDKDDDIERARSLLGRPARVDRQYRRGDRLHADRAFPLHRDRQPAQGRARSALGRIWCARPNRPDPAARAGARSRFSAPILRKPICVSSSDHVMRPPRCHRRRRNRRRSGSAHRSSSFQRHLNRQEKHHGTETASGPCGLQEAPLLPHRRRRRALAARRPLHRARRRVEPDAAQGRRGQARDARRGTRQALARRRARSRPIACCVSSTRPASPSARARNNPNKAKPGKKAQERLEEQRIKEEGSRRSGKGG